MQKLLIEDDEGRTVVVPLIRDEITIGREDGNTIRLSEQNVSRHHARLVRRQGALLLEDLSSYNGTKLNGAVLSASAPLKDGDVFLIGDYRMAIKEDRPSAPMGATPTAHAAAASSAAPAGAAAPLGNEVRDTIEAQPTIPLHSLGKEASLADSASPSARLVIVGRSAEAREFILDRPSLVIGRTPENDIVIEHKSISRHHARIVREGNQYYAVDLESANGVRVNGVDHDRVLLRPGDEIELGQVQLRFVTEEGGGKNLVPLLVCLRGASEIPGTSVYKERASALEQSARTDYVKLHADAASTKARVGACDEAKQEADLVLAVDGANKTARWIIGRCAALARKEASPRPEVKKPAQAAPQPMAAVVQPKPAAPPPAQTEPSADPDRLIQQAREAWLRGQYVLAVDSARKALRAKPGLTSAYQIIAICSCSLHDPDTAMRAYEKLDDRNKQLVRSACQKNGISF
jgi:pSer/pThr/pTyr-binding forkhead associated (FHA) protein